MTYAVGCQMGLMLAIESPEYARLLYQMAIDELPAIDHMKGRLNIQRFVLEHPLRAEGEVPI